MIYCYYYNIILLCPVSPVTDIGRDEGFVSENPFVDPRRLRRSKGRADWTRWVLYGLHNPRHTLHYIILLLLLLLFYARA